MLSQIIRYSWAIPFGAIGSYLVNWVDAWVIRAFLGTAYVGLYQWAYQISAIGPMIFAPLGVVLIPGMVDARLDGDEVKLSRHGHRSLKAMIFMGLLGTIALIFIYPIVSIIGNMEYVRTYSVILILISAIPFQFVGYLMNPIGAAFEQIISKLALISLGIAAVNMFGDLWLVPIMGMNGAALATAITFALSGLLQVWIIMYYVKGFPKIIDFIIAGLIMPAGALSLYFLGPTLGAIICLFVSSGILIVIKEIGLFSNEDAEWVATLAMPNSIKPYIQGFFNWLAKSKTNRDGANN